MGVQRILANHNNAVPAASIAATSILAAPRSLYQEQTARSGNGIIALTGDYAGDADATFEIEIRPASTGAERATTPTFAGAGNGTITQPTVAGGTAAQTITATLVDLGTETTQARAILYADVLLQAKTAGTGGNAITLELTHNLSLITPAVGTLAADLARDTQEVSDQRMDFGALPLNPDGTIPDDAPRLVFARDVSRVYRHYKRWDGEQWQYGLSPKLAAAHAKGAEVHAVTGHYSAIIRSGSTTETYPNLSTLYDLLIALGASALVSVSTPPANDRRPGGMAAVDLPFRTAAFALPATKSRADLLDLTAVTVADTAPTETVTVKCIDDSAIGSEIWSVSSRVAGALTNAVTGEPYLAGFLGFTIPVAPLTERPVTGRINITAESYPRDAGDTTGTPSICLYRPILGAAASSKSLKLVWTQRPSTEGCDCTSAAVTGKPNEAWLGVDMGDIDMAALAAGHRARLEALMGWYKTFVAANTEKTAAGELRSAEYDLQLAELASSELNDCLTDLYTNIDAVLTDPDWAASTAYSIDTVVEPVTRNGYRYRVTVAGTSGSTQPTWPTTIGNTVTDGAVTWKCVSKISEFAWDDVLTAVSTDLTALAAIGSETPTLSYPATVISSGIPEVKLSAAPTQGTIYVMTGSDGVAHRYLAAKVTTTGTPTYYGTVPRHITGGIKEEFGSDAGGTWLILWDDLGPVGDTEDVNSVASAAADPGIARDPKSYVTRYASALNEVRAIAGLPPKKSSAGLTGSAIWQDLGTDYWVVSGEDYLPIFNNVYYHSCVEQTDSDGNTFIVPTYEFGLAVRVGCAERLEYGDSITISLSGVAVNRPYVEGDSYDIPVVQGSPLSFSGGIDGSDAITWKVESSTAGALASYVLTLAESAYSNGGVGFTIHRGAIPFALGDAFTFAVEVGGRFRWRKDSGAWSSDMAIAATASLSDGLTAAFTGGAAPSFVEGDVYRYAAKQPNAPSHVASAHGERWRWVGSSATLTITWATDQTISVVGLLRHGLVSPATVSIALKDSGGTTLQTVTPTVGSGPILSVLPTTLTTVRSITVAVSSATDMNLGWVYAGVPFSTARNASVTLRRSYALDREDGWNARAAYLGSGKGGEIAWGDSWIVQSEFDALLALVDACKADGDAPIVLIPNVQNPGDAVLARIDSDTLDVSDVFSFQPNDAGRRRLSLTVPLAAVLQ